MSQASSAVDTEYVTYVLRNTYAPALKQPACLGSENRDAGLNPASVLYFLFR